MMKYLITIGFLLLFSVYGINAQSDYKNSSSIVSTGGAWSANSSYGNFGIIGEPLVTGKTSAAQSQSSLGFIYNESVMHVVPPNPAVLIYPPNNTLLSRLPDTPLSITFFWTPQTGVDFNIQVSENDDFSSNIVDTTVGTNYLTYEINNDGMLYWRVKVLRGSVESEWSPVWKFSILVTDVEAENSLQIYPNPVENIMQIILPAELAGGELAIVDLFGNERVSLNNLSSINAIELNQIQPGVYFLIIAKGSQRITRKIIKE